MASKPPKKSYVLFTDQAPKPLGPYSQAIRSFGFIFLSGQIGLDPKTGQLVSDDVAQQTEQIMKNLQALLHAAGQEVTQLIKTTIYLLDINDFATVNQVYSRYVSPQSFPARTTVQVAALPLGARVEIDAIAAEDFSSKTGARQDDLNL